MNPFPFKIDTRPSETPVETRPKLSDYQPPQVPPRELPELDEARTPRHYERDYRDYLSAIGLVTMLMSLGVYLIYAAINFGMGILLLPPQGIGHVLFGVGFLLMAVASFLPKWRCAG